MGANSQYGINLQYLSFIPLDLDFKQIHVKQVVLLLESPVVSDESMC